MDCAPDASSLQILMRNPSTGASRLEGPAQPPDLARREPEEGSGARLWPTVLNDPSNDLEALQFLGAHRDQLLSHPSAFQATRRRQKRTFLLGRNRTFSCGRYRASYRKTLVSDSKSGFELPTRPASSCPAGGAGASAPASRTRACARSPTAPPDGAAGRRRGGGGARRPAAPALTEGSRRASTSSGRERTRPPGSPGPPSPRARRRAPRRSRRPASGRPPR